LSVEGRSARAHLRADQNVFSRVRCWPGRIMPVVLEKGGAIPGIIMLIIAGCGAWSLWGAALSRTCDALKRPRWLP